MLRNRNGHFGQLNKQRASKSRYTVPQLAARCFRNKKELGTREVEPFRSWDSYSLSVPKFVFGDGQAAMLRDVNRRFKSPSLGVYHFGDVSRLNPAHYLRQDIEISDQGHKSVPIGQRLPRPEYDPGKRKDWRHYVDEVDKQGAWADCTRNPRLGDNPRHTSYHLTCTFAVHGHYLTPQTMPGTRKGKTKVLSSACAFGYLVVVRPHLTNTFRCRMQAFEAQGES